MSLLSTSIVGVGSAYEACGSWSQGCKA